FWAFAEARRRLHQAIEFAFVNRGFFEDELRMLGNATTNFRTYDFRLLELKPRLERPETAAIVGAGPSLDDTIETLRRIRERVLLFSCGTALRPLLKRGFIPDFHCELENIPELHGVIEETARFGDLSQMTLIASATVDPRVPRFFGQTIFLFRDLVSSTEILGRRFHIVPGVSPTCVNLGLAAGVALGCTDFVFFGTDCGTRPGGKRHADGTIYGELGVWQERDSRKRNTIELEGNFGGTIATDWVYDACRVMLANSIEVRCLTVQNCSDGALIPGARPCAPESFEIVKPPVDRGALQRALEIQLRHFATGELLDECDLSGLGAEAERMFGDLFGLLDEVALDPDFAALHDRLRMFASTAADQYGGCLSIIGGTVTALPRIAMFYGARLDEGPLRRALYARAIEEIRGIVAEMQERTCALLREVAPDRAMLPAA
ncbi:MAG: motility associated factor glycosyltransferase family protein, partial [Stellaceae bacterium]